MVYWYRYKYNKSHLFFRVGQKIPENAKELAEDYLQVVKPMVSEASVIGNMNETPMWFDCPGDATVDFKGVKTILSKTTGNEKLR